MKKGREGWKDGGKVREEGEERVRGGREMGEGSGGKGRRGRDGLLACSKVFLCLLSCKKPKNKKIEA